MSLPIDRTKLNEAIANQVAGNTASAEKNINAIKVVYDTIDELNQKVDNYIANPTIPDGSVTVGKLADNAVVTSKIANGAVTPPKIPNGSLTAEKFVPGALTNDTQNGLRITQLESEMAVVKGKTYTHTSVGGPGISNVDTDITLSVGGVWQIFVIGNPLPPGSQLYRAINMGYVTTNYDLSGNIGYFVNYIEHFRVKGYNYLSVDVVIWNGTSEVPVTANPNYTLRVKVSGYASGYEGSNQQVLIRRLL